MRSAKIQDLFLSYYKNTTYGQWIKFNLLLINEIFETPDLRYISNNILTYIVL